MSSIELEDGKYIITHDNGVNLKCSRHGRYWQDLDGDKLALALVQKIEQLQVDREELRAFLSRVVSVAGDKQTFIMARQLLMKHFSTKTGA